MNSANTGVEVVRVAASDWSSYLVALGRHFRSVSSVSLSHGGARVASGSWDNTVRLWDANTGMTTAILIGHSSWITSVAFSPDDTRLASGSGDGTVGLWDVNTGISTATLTGHSGWVTSVSFSPDGTHVASGSWDNTIRLWDATAGVSTAILTGHSSAIISIIFSPDTTHIQSQDLSSQTVIWNVLPGFRADYGSCQRSDDDNSHGNNAFKVEDGRLNWEPSDNLMYPVCSLPSGTDVTKVESRMLKDGVKVVVIGCKTGRVIIMHALVWRGGRRVDQ